MTRIMLAAIAALCASAADAAERRYTVTDFDRIEVSGPYEVSLVTGRPPAAVARGDQRAIDRLTMEVQGRVLRIRPGRSSWGGYPGEAGGAVSIAVATHGLRAATLAGSGSLEIDAVKAMKFDAALSGSGRVTLGKVEADALSLTLLGGGRLVASGKAKTLRAAVSGSGDLEGSGLLVEDAQLNAATSGNVGLAVRRAVSLDASGAGDIEIAGKPACTVRQTGTGRITCGS